MIGIALLGAGRMARVHAKGIGVAGGKLVTVFDVVEPAAAVSLQMGRAIDLEANCKVTWI
jgi:myo-inositol 2-dehydrogenase/D-chiro-inositol 1-dehydrogenase